MTAAADTLREEIRRRSADACFGTALYDDLDGPPEGAGHASLGCGNPTAVA